MKNQLAIKNSIIGKSDKGKKHLFKTMKKYKSIYFLMMPALIYYIIFRYLPMFGIIIAFKDVAPYEGIKGIITAPWVGMKHFVNFFHSYYFWNVLSNTLIISFYKLLFGFPVPIILALCINEVENKQFKKFVQTVSYLPHFISMVVLAGMVTSLLSTNGGLLNEILKLFGKEPIHFLGDPKYFRKILVLSDIWKEAGWSSIIYLAAITGVDTQLYEAAIVDGASKFQRIWHITIPGISSIIIIMLIFAVGGILNAGFEQVLLLYSPSVYKVGDIIDTYVYREGLINVNYSFATAVGLFKSIVALILITFTNFLAKKFDQPGIW